MDNPTIKIVNLEDNTTEERAMNAQELTQWQIDEAAAIAQIEARAKAQAKRQALLDKLGITEDEARLLLGGN